MTKKKKKGPVRSITLGSVLTWFFGLSFLLIAVTIPFTGSKVAGVIMLVLAAVTLPPVNKFVEKKFNFKLSKFLKAGIIFLGLILFVVAVQPEPICGDNSCNGSETCSTCSEDCGRCAEDISREKKAIEALQEQALEKMKDSVVFVKNEYTAKNKDGSYVKASQTGSGVITSSTGTTLTVYTTRNVADCFYARNCYQKLTEKITVRTRDGKIYTTSGVSVAKHKLNIAKLSVFIPSVKKYPAATIGDADVGDSVMAVGYPVSEAGNIVEFSVTKGTVSAKRNLMMDDGFAFTSFDSNAFTNKGTRGGGLFNADGQLIGINTWRKQELSSRAIQIPKLLKIPFVFCSTDMYFDKNDRCKKICRKDQILMDDGSCIDRCTTFYCNNVFPYNYKEKACNYKNRQVKGSDGLCHNTCGLRNRWCALGAYCLSNKCIGCKSGSKLFKNGFCSKWENHYGYS